jgi:hypothetical protein
MMRRVAFAMAALGVVLLVLGVLLLTVEVELFRWTTQDHDFSGLRCGTPLDHPDWARGEPCDGAVNRQTAVAGVVLFGGLGALGAAVVAHVGGRSTTPPPSP